METLTNEFKTELLNALSDLEISYDEFEHQLEDCATTYATLKKVIETENLTITIEFEETAVWESYDYFETTNLEITYLEVVCENGICNTEHLTDHELMKYINY